MLRPLRPVPRPTPQTGWATVIPSSAIMVLSLVEIGGGHLLSGGHTPLWLVAGVAGVPGGAMLIGSTHP